MKNIYKEKYKSEGRLALTENSRIKIMLDIANRYDFENKNILDIGCYDGTFLVSLKGKATLYGIEASDFGYNESLKKGIDIKQFFFDDKTSLPFEDNFFHMVVAGEIIEHIFDTDFFLEEVYRILKPGGRFLISTPNIASFGRRLLLAMGINPIIELSPHEKDSSGHIRYFTFSSLRNLLEKHNFKIILTRSDIVNFSSSGKLNSSFLAKLFPTLGQSLIVLCKKSTKI